MREAGFENIIYLCSNMTILSKMANTGCVLCEHIPINLDVHLDHLIGWETDEETNFRQEDMIQSFKVLREYRESHDLPNSVVKSIRVSEKYLAEQILNGSGSNNVSFDDLKKAS